jgi:hypothetical protein
VEGEHQVSTELALREEQRANVALSNDQLQYIAHTEFVPQGLRGNVPAIMACVATGRALGIDDMSALRLIHVVNGRPTFSAELMVQIVRRYGHSIVGESKEGSCTITGKRADNGDTMTVTWTLAMAERAGLASKPTWRSYPEAMLWARAASQLCRMLFADCFAGATYTPEELEAGEPQATTQPARSDDVSQAALEPAEPASPASKRASAAQKKKLDVLVGQLRDAGRIATEDVWEFLGKQDQMGDAMDSTMVVHWSPLRERLSKDEASFLIDTLERFAADQDAAWAAGSSSTNEEPQAEVTSGGATPSNEVPVSQAVAVHLASASSGLTMTELRHRVEQAGVTPEHGSAVMARLFPGRKSSELTDGERGVFWAELESSLQPIGGAERALPRSHRPLRTC